MANVRETTSSFLPIIASSGSAAKGMDSSSQSSFTLFSGCWDWFFQDTFFLAWFLTPFPSWELVLIGIFALSLPSSLAFFRK